MTPRQNAFPFIFKVFLELSDAIIHFLSLNVVKKNIKKGSWFKAYSSNDLFQCTHPKTPGDARNCRIYCRLYFVLMYTLLIESFLYSRQNIWLTTVNNNKAEQLQCTTLNVWFSLFQNISLGQGFSLEAQVPAW